MATYQKLKAATHNGSQFNSSSVAEDGTQYVGEGKLPFHVFSSSQEASQAAAREIADLIEQRAAEEKSCVLGN